MENLINLTTKLEELKTEVEQLPEGAMKIFWDRFLTPVYHYQAFTGGIFDFDTFWPTKDIICNDSGGIYTAQRLFYNFTKGNCAQSLKRRLEQCGVKIVLTQTTSIRQFATWASITEYPELDLTTITDKEGLHQSFAYCQKRIKRIERLISSPGTYWNDNTFYDSNLEHCVIAGTIGTGTFNIQGSTLLDKESLLSIITALSDTTNGLTCKLSLVAVNREFETNAGLNNGSTSPEWTAKVAAKPNWTINLL